VGVLTGKPDIPETDPVIHILQEELPWWPMRCDGVGSFDFAGTSLREVPAALRMTMSAESGKLTSGNPGQPALTY
jgi:hypothetical protein